MTEQKTAGSEFHVTDPNQMHSRIKLTMSHDVVSVDSFFIIYFHKFRARKVLNIPLVKLLGPAFAKLHKKVYTEWLAA
jgi:hypothetical protein